jgi:hypothetical protein
MNATQSPERFLGIQLAAVRRRAAERAPGPGPR